MTTIRVHIDAKGPLFEGEPGQKVIKAVNEGLLEVAQTGEFWVKTQLYEGHGKVTGHLRRSIAGTLRGNLRAQIDAGEMVQGANVVYANWVEGIDPRNRRSRFKGYHMFRNAFNRIKKLDMDKIIGDRIRRVLNGA